MTTEQDESRDSDAEWDSIIDRFAKNLDDAATDDEELCVTRTYDSAESAAVQRYMLKQLEHKAAKNDQELQELDALKRYYNDLQRVEAETNEKLRVLREVKKNYIRSQRINAATHEQLRNLSELKKHYNKVQQLDAENSEQLRKLTMLEKKYNDLQYRMAETYEELRYLTNLQKNITALESADTESDERLRKLNMLKNFSDLQRQMAMCNKEFCETNNIKKGLKAECLAQKKNHEQVRVFCDLTDNEATTDDDDNSSVSGSSTSSVATVIPRMTQKPMSEVAPTPVHRTAPYEATNTVADRRQRDTNLFLMSQANGGLNCTQRTCDADKSTMHLKPSAFGKRPLVTEQRPSKIATVQPSATTVKPGTSSMKRKSTAEAPTKTKKTRRVRVCVPRPKVDVTAVPKKTVDVNAAPKTTTNGIRRIIGTSIRHPINVTKKTTPKTRKTRKARVTVSPPKRLLTNVDL